MPFVDFCYFTAYFGIYFVDAVLAIYSLTKLLK